MKSLIITTLLFLPFYLKSQNTDCKFSFIDSSKLSKIELYKLLEYGFQRHLKILRTSYKWMTKN